jgi:two-component system cell cycle response regulator PopA
LGSDPRLVIIAESDARIESLCRGLDALGWRTVTARTSDAAGAALQDFAIEAAVIDAAHPDCSGMALELRRASGQRRLAIVIIGGNPEDEDPDVDLIMSGVPHPSQLALRAEQLVRAAIAEEEFELRRATLLQYGTSLKLDPDDPAPLRILVAGGADPRFLALSNALTSVGAEVVAAPTPYTAFDYLHEAAFDGAVLWGAPDHAPALSIASGMKRNTRLYHIPLTLYLRDAGEINLSDLYNRGFADVATADTSELETAARVMALASAHRRLVTIRKALESARGSSLMDPATGLFTRELFAAHLARLAEGARARRRPLSVCVLRVSDASDLAHARAGGWLDRAMPQIGAMVSRLVRVEDTAARLAPEVFALALPATSGAAARLTAERIGAVVACTAFDAGPDRSPFVVEFDIGTAPVASGENPASVLERASADLIARKAARVS